MKLMVIVYYSEGRRERQFMGWWPPEVPGVELLASPCGARLLCVTVLSVLPTREAGPGLTVQSRYWGSILCVMEGCIDCPHA